MKRLLLTMAVAALLAPPFVHARDGGWRFGPSLQAEGPPVKKAPPRGGGREYRREMPPPRDDGRRVTEDERRPGGRLSEEERRELLRDLDRANREIYRPGRGR